MATSGSTAPLTLISADCHAGGSHEQYREYLDPAYREDFDAWRGKYKNPWKDLRSSSQLRTRRSVSRRSFHGFLYFPRQASKSSRYAGSRYSRYCSWLPPAWQSAEMSVRGAVDADVAMQIRL